MTVKKIFSTAKAAVTPANVAPGMIATNMRSITTVPRLAGSTAVQARPDGVCGEHRRKADVGVRVCGPQDEEPSQRDEGGRAVRSATAAIRYQPETDAPCPRARRSSPTRRRRADRDHRARAPPAAIQPRTLRMRRPRESIPIGLTALLADVARTHRIPSVGAAACARAEVPSAHRATLVGRLRARRPEVVAGGVARSRRRRLRPSSSAIPTTSE